MYVAYKLCMYVYMNVWVLYWYDYYLFCFHYLLTKIFQNEMFLCICLTMTLKGHKYLALPLLNHWLVYVLLTSPCLFCFLSISLSITYSLQIAFQCIECHCQCFYNIFCVWSLMAKRAREEEHDFFYSCVI